MTGIKGSICHSAATFSTTYITLTGERPATERQNHDTFFEVKRICITCTDSVHTSEKTVCIHKIEYQLMLHREIKMFIARILRTPKDTLSECVVLDAFAKL